MDARILEKYIEKIYSFAISKTFTPDEADDLSQDILYQAVASLPKLTDESRFEPWLWRLASNCAFSFRRQKGKERAFYLYNVPEEDFEQVSVEDNDEETYDFLREKIAMLSVKYRDIIILFYYDGLSTKEISERLSLPEGTVTWRLSEARKKLKKECQTMEETALKPQKIRLDIYGSGNFSPDTRPYPNTYIEDALSQNILFFCYEKPQDVESISKYSGVPAYYIEDRLEYLIKRNAIIEQPKGKYQTDFIIWSDKYGEFCEKNAESYVKPVMGKLQDALKKLFTEADKIPFYRADKSADELNYLYGVLAFDYICKNLYKEEYPRIPENYDGYRWRYTGSVETWKYRRITVGHQICKSPGCTSYGHQSFWLKGFEGRNMMFDSNILACESLLDPNVTCDKGKIADTVELGYIVRKEDGTLKVTPPAFTKAQTEELYRIIHEIFSPIADEYIACVQNFIKDYRKLFPKHLELDAKRMCHNMVCDFFEVVADRCVKDGILKAPKKDWICDVLLQY